MRLGIVAAITAYLVSIAPSALATPLASEALCGGLTWPRPMPDVVGLTVDPLSNAVQPLTCLDGVKMVGPDGAVLTGVTGGSLSRIASVSPAPGTPDRSPDRHSVSSQLRLSAHHVVDAASEYAVSTARDSTTVDGIGIKASCTQVSKAVADKPVHRLYVLLPGEHLYLATGWGGESCDVLEQFAQAAIPRIGA